MHNSSAKLLWVSPFPPLESGISQYSRDLLDCVDGAWDLAVLAEPGSASVGWRWVEQVTTTRFGGEYLPIYNIGNSGLHPYAFRLALERPGLLVLHDVVLHHARLADFVRRGRGREYIEIMEARYGTQGRDVAQQVLRGATLDLSEFPLSEDYLAASGLVVVHSPHAQARALEIVPDATVGIVPMGVPLPHLIGQSEARTHLSLPQSAYVIASITHVNPMKRLNIVLRALRRLVERVPEAVLVIAGSVSPGVDLERQISLLGLERHVRIVGYVSDADSRILARASDVAVNLRYPSAGETSASLLRLLGAALPVVVTAHGPALELPAGVALKVPVDRFEVETLTEYLAWLAVDDTARLTLGASARGFVEQHHSMGAACDGYRDAIQRAFGMTLPGVAHPLMSEPAPVLRSPSRGRREYVKLNAVQVGVVDALSDLGLDRHGGTIEAMAAALVELDLNRQQTGGLVSGKEDQVIDPELLAVLACPVCKTPVRLDDTELVCDNCGRHYRIDDGIPIMLADEATK